MFIVVNLDVVLHNNKYIPTHSMSWHAMSAGQQLTQMPYEKCLEFKKNAIGHTTFVGGGLTCLPETLCVHYSS